MRCNCNSDLPVIYTIIKTVVYILKVFKTVELSLNQCPVFKMFTAPCYYTNFCTVCDEQLCIVVSFYIYFCLGFVFDSSKKDLPWTRYVCWFYFLRLKNVIRILQSNFLEFIWTKQFDGLRMIFCFASDLLFCVRSSVLRLIFCFAFDLPFCKWSALWRLIFCFSPICCFACDLLLSVWSAVFLLIVCFVCDLRFCVWSALLRLIFCFSQICSFACDLLFCVWYAVLLLIYFSSICSLLVICFFVPDLLFCVWLSLS